MAIQWPQGKTMGRNENRKIKPGISIDKEIWEQFKKKYPNSSQTVQSMMQQAIQAEEIPKSFTSDGLASITLSNPTNWSMSWGNDNVKLENVSYSTTSNNQTDVIFDWRDIKIE